MAQIRFSAVIVVLFIFGLLAGCSSGGSNPVAPDNGAESIDGAPIIGLTDADGVLTATGLMGVYELTLNPDLSADFVTKRVSTIGEDYLVSGQAFFTMAPCPDCLQLAGIGLTADGDAKLTFKISHPFPKGNTGAPPTAANRLDLDVFDLAMVVAPDSATATTYTLTGGSVYTDLCVNADGYTKELANLVSDQAAMPYFLVVDDSIGGTSTNNKFEMGTVDSFFDVFFKLPGTPLTFDTYLTMGYGFGAKKPDRLNPKYYLPEFNKKPAWKVVVMPPEGEDPPDTTNTWLDEDTTTEFDVTVHVYDWQIGATVYGTPDSFEDAPADNIYAASEVASVSVEIPGMNSSLQTVSSAASGTGMPGSPLEFVLPIANQNGLAEGEYLGLVKVTDQRAPLSEAQLRDYLIHTPDGINLPGYNIPEYATYQTFTATVLTNPCGPITGTIDSPTCPYTAFNGETLNFTCSASSDNGGDPIVLYEWDMDYDGSTFDVDATGDDICLGPFSCDSGSPKTYTVAVRATDSCDPPNVTVFATCEVDVSNCDEQPIISTKYVAKDEEDVLFDIGVQANGYVYVIADHEALGLTEETRTAIRYDNDLTNMTVMAQNTDGMRILNPGLNNPPNYSFNSFPVPWGPTYVKYIDVLDNGNVIVDTANRAIGIYDLSTDPIQEYLCCLRIRCSDYADAYFDVWYQDDGGSYADKCGVGMQDAGLDCFSTRGSQAYTCWIGQGTPWPLLYDGGAHSIEDFIDVWDASAEKYSVVGVDGLHGTENSLVFVSDSTNGYLSELGSLLSVYTGGGVLAEHGRWGSYGTGDNEFFGGLDVTIDSAGNIITLEKHGCMYRFQKFDSSVTWVYSSWWTNEGNPLRIDFDTGDDELFVLCDSGVHGCSVL